MMPYGITRPQWVIQRLHFDHLGQQTEQCSNTDHGKIILPHLLFYQNNTADKNFEKLAAFTFIGILANTTGDEGVEECLLP